MVMNTELDGVVIEVGPYRFILCEFAPSLALPTMDVSCAVSFRCVVEFAHSTVVLCVSHKTLEST